MKTIPLSQGLYAWVDDEDYACLSKYKWCAKWSGIYFYAVRSVRVNGKTKAIIMHREILSAPPKKDIDHINHNTLDNRKRNLRICSRKENSRNANKTWGISKYKGVTWHKNNQIYQAYIVCNYKFIYLGSFKNEIDAAKAYDKKAKELFGEFAQVNFL